MNAPPLISRSRWNWTTVRGLHLSKRRIWFQNLWKIRYIAYFLLISLVLGQVGCDLEHKAPHNLDAGVGSQKPKMTPPPTPSASRSDNIPKGNNPGLENVIPLTATVVSGAQPEGDEAFASLARLGIKTVVSVDGSRPDIKTANKYGLQYVHIPIGYDGIGEKAGLSLARLARQGKRPLYIHCHHGQHRGPAAAAVICLVNGDVDRQGALQFLNRAGTSKSYRGLWRAVANYQPPPMNSRLPKLVSIAKLESLTSVMAKLDRIFDNLKQCQEASWGTPEDHPDIDPKQEALLLRETLHEANRNLLRKYDQEFKNLMNRSESLARELETALSKAELKAASIHFLSLKRSCTQCHAKYRN